MFTCVRPPSGGISRLYDSATAAFLHRSDGPLGHAVGLWKSCSRGRKPPLACFGCCDQLWRAVAEEIRDLVFRTSKVLHCFNGVGGLTMSGRLLSTSWLYPRRPPRLCRWERPCLQHRLRSLLIIRYPITWFPNFTGCFLALMTSSSSVTTFGFLCLRWILALAQTSQCGFFGRWHNMCSVVLASSADPVAIVSSSPSGIVANTAPAFAGNGDSPSAGAGAAVWHVGGNGKPYCRSSLAVAAGTLPHEACTNNTIAVELR